MENGSALRSIVLVGVILAVVVLALFGMAWVLDIGDQEELQEALMKTLLVIAILTALALAIWGVVKLGKRD